MNTKLLILAQIGMILLGIYLSVFVLPDMMIMTEGKTPDECYAFTNATYGTYKSHGKCYVESFESYETTRVCTGGIIGIGESCTYQPDHPVREFYRTQECWVIKTGERC